MSSYAEHVKRMTKQETEDEVMKESKRLQTEGFYDTITAQADRAKLCEGPGGGTLSDTSAGSLKNDSDHRAVGASRAPATHLSTPNVSSSALTRAQAYARFAHISAAKRDSAGADPVVEAMLDATKVLLITVTIMNACPWVSLSHNTCHSAVALPTDESRSS
jgi:hypothetical protein